MISDREFRIPRATRVEDTSTSEACAHQRPISAQPANDPSQPHWLARNRESIDHLVLLGGQAQGPKDAWCQL